MDGYEAALNRLFRSDPLPKLGLSKMGKLLDRLGNPQKSYPSFHVAGTNGKGSTCAFLESVLRTAGYRVGLYTSPHLMCARERIQINRELISESDFIRLESLVSLEGTFFERMTAMAFLYFSEQKVDIAVIEVGLGGRLDATNLITPIVCGISQIALDHQAFLGDSLEQIAAEKAGIMKAGVPVVWSPQVSQVECILRQAVVVHRATQSKFPAASPFQKGEVGLGLKGPHQIENATLALDMLEASGLPITQKSVEQGLLSTQWPCRYERLGNVILDGAHNPAGILALIKTHPAQAPVLLIGMTEGHDTLLMAQLLQKAYPRARIIVGRSRSLRALSAELAADCFKRVGFKEVRILSEPAQALAEAQASGDFVLVTGSLYWAGEVRSNLLPMPADKLAVFY